MILLRFAFLIVAAWLLLVVSRAANAETWPPLKPPNPLTPEWVIKHTLTRFPEVHARHRAYLAALAKAEAINDVAVPAAPVNRDGLADLGSNRAPSVPALRRELAEREADLVFADALEHHMMLQWQAHTAYLDYLLAQESLQLMENHKRLVDAYVPATRTRTHQQTNMTDLGLESARLAVTLLKLNQNKVEAAWRINALTDRAWQAELTPARLGAPTPLPAPREQLIANSLKFSPPARRIAAQLKRGAAELALAKAGDSSAPPLAAATHSFAGAEDQQRGTNVTLVRDVTLAYEGARVKRDMTTIYNNEIVPRAQQRAIALTASYRNGRLDVIELIARLREQVDTEIEALHARIEYEKSLAELTRLIGVLPDYAARTMSERPLNTSREPRAQ